MVKAILIKLFYEFFMKIKLQQKLGGLLATVGLGLITACGSSSSDGQTGPATPTTPLPATLSGSATGIKNQEQDYIDVLRKFVTPGEPGVSLSLINRNQINPSGNKYIFAAVTSLDDNDMLQLNHITQPGDWSLDHRKALFSGWSEGANSLVVEKTVADEYLGDVDYTLDRIYMNGYKDGEGPMVNGRPAGTERILHMAEILLEKDPEDFPPDEYTRIVKIYPYNNPAFPSSYGGYLLVKPQPLDPKGADPQPNLAVDLADVELVDYSYASFLEELPYPLSALTALLDSEAMAKKLEEIALTLVVPAELRPDNKFISPRGEVLDCNPADHDGCGILYLFAVDDPGSFSLAGGSAAAYRGIFPNAIDPGNDEPKAAYEQAVTALKNLPGHQGMIRDYCQSSRQENRRSDPNLSLYWFCSQVDDFLNSLPELVGNDN